MIEIDGQQQVVEHPRCPDQGTPIVEGFDVARDSLPSPDLLRQLIHYDPETGRLTWRARTAANISEFGSTDRALRSWNGKYAGKYADVTLTTAGYRSVCVYDRRFSAHRAAWAIFHGSWPEHEIDHINHNKIDNRIVNLRDVPHVLNARNQPLRSDNKSGVVGIWEQKPKAWGARWHVIISEGSRIVSKRSFRCIGQAVRFRNDNYRRRGFLPVHGAANPQAVKAE